MGERGEEGEEREMEGEGNGKEKEERGDGGGVKREEDEDLAREKTWTKRLSSAASFHRAVTYTCIEEDKKMISGVHVSTTHMRGGWVGGGGIGEERSRLLRGAER